MITSKEALNCLKDSVKAYISLTYVVLEYDFG